MTSGQDVSEYLDILGLVKSYFSSFFSYFSSFLRKKNRKKKGLVLIRRPEDEAICLFAGLLANPDVPLSQFTNSFALSIHNKQLKLVVAGNFS